MSTAFTRLIIVSCLLLTNPLQAQQLNITTSADTDSNAAHSFVIVPPGKTIPHGLKHNAVAGNLEVQIPFTVELIPGADANLTLQWQITIPSKKYGNIDVLSKFPGNTRQEPDKIIWRSQPLAATIVDRNKLVFKPGAHTHQPTIYRKGLGGNGARHPYGGGTRIVDDATYNPRLSYQIQLALLRNDEVIENYDATISMDDKDMIRQEYINHYAIKRYGYGAAGNLPVPRRDELTAAPKKPADVIGNPLTESAYGLSVNDGMPELAQRVTEIYRAQKIQYQEKPLLDLNKNALQIPQSKLWLSGGWRNPERNEWFSNAANGIHQRGGAIDVIPNEPPGDINNAIAYWVLWNGLQQHKKDFSAYWQLETRGRPMRTNEFKEDIEPANGIPDAFDKADHLHINIHYETKVEE